MNVVKHFALQRGVRGLSFAGVELPVEIALDQDQFAPLLVAAAAFTYGQSGLLRADMPFPWTLDIDEESDTALFNGAYVKPQPSILPKAVGYLFLDYEMENIIKECRLDPNADHRIAAMDSLAQKLEVIEHEPKWSRRTPFNPSF